MKQVMKQLRDATQFRAATAVLRWLALAFLSAAPVNDLWAAVSQVPLYISTATEPNVMLVVDDSQSMAWSFMPDEVCDLGGTSNSATQRTKKYVRSSNYNKLYYNPAITYLPPKNADGTTFANASFTAAAWNGFAASGAPSGVNPLVDAPVPTVVNLSSAYKATWGDGFNKLDQSKSPAGESCDNASVYADTAASTAYYYNFNASATCTAGTSSDTDESCYSKVTVSATSGSSRSRPELTGSPVSTDETTNFANWFSFYRTRILATRTSITRAFADLSGIRVGYGRLNASRSYSASDADCGNMGDIKMTVDGLSGLTTRTIQRGVRPFTGADKNDLFTWVGSFPICPSTYLRQAVFDVGNYYTMTSDKGPWGQYPGTGGGTQYACRKSFMVLTTDGYYNDNDLSGKPYSSNLTKYPFQDLDVDGSKGTEVTGPVSKKFTYSPKSPFQDGASSTQTNKMADIAQYYWATDLNPALENRLQTKTGDDPAFWQHMSIFGLGFGVKGTVNPDEAADQRTATTPKAINWWPTGSTTDQRKANDFIHATVNSWGRFYAAADPTTFVNSLQGALTDIVTSTRSTSSNVAANSTRLDSGSLVYQAKFDTSDWSGDILAYALDANGELATKETWKASEHIPAAIDRTILTWVPTSCAAPTTGDGGVFKWSGTSALASCQKTALKSSDILDWVRGDKSKADAGQNAAGTTPAIKLRKRTNILGDIVNSDPAYLRLADYGWGSSRALTASERNAYITRQYNSAYATRPGVLYVGANDGMLHAFQGVTATGVSGGTELFAYVPNAVIQNLPALATEGYGHQYYVDGAVAASDALVGSTWKSVVVGSTGAGGKAYFALDVEDPANMSAANVLWEFTHTELGSAIGKASIIRTKSGHWVAIFGNGYGSTSQKAQLFVVDIQTGALLKVLDTGVGSATSPNGLATPLAVDVNGDSATDVVYAGDLLGNMWKFDFSGSAVSDWKIAFGGKPLVTVKHQVNATTSTVQPITVRPRIRLHPLGGFMLYFGTGKYFETGDGSNTDIQAFYGVRDVCAGSPTTTGCGTLTAAKVAFSDLVKQTITSEVKVTKDVDVTTGVTTGFEETIRQVSNNAVDANKGGFYLELLFGSKETGERVVSEAVTLSNAVLFASGTPSSDPCTPGNEGWLMAINPFTGGRLSKDFFDLNNDGLFDTKDRSAESAVTTSGVKSPNGMIKTPAIVVGDNRAKAVTATTGAALDALGIDAVLKSQRRTWKQLR